MRAPSVYHEVSTNWGREKGEGEEEEEEEGDVVVRGEGKEES